MSAKTNPMAATVGFRRQRAGASLSKDHDTTPDHRRQERRPLYSPDGKVCAVLEGGVLKKAVEGSKHFLRQPRAIALDLGAVQAAEAEGVSLVVVTDRETSTVYRTTISELHQRGWEFNRGCGEQIALRVERWERDETRRQGKKQSPDLVSRPPAQLQPTLF
jgi:hypothetical protein